MITLPTYVTFFRIIITPCIVLAVVAGMWGVSFFFFCCAALSDLVDGLLARSLNLHSALGACLDAFADKFLILSVFTTLSMCNSPFVPFWLFIVILLKEAVLLSGAAYVGITKGWDAIRPSFLGKLTMCVQVAFILWIFLCKICGWVPLKTGVATSILVSVVTAGALAHYAWVAWPIKEQTKIVR